MKYLGVIILLTLLLIPLVNAEVKNLGNFRQGEAINVLQACNCSYANITKITSPTNNSQIFGNAPMTKVGLSFNYTIPSNYTQAIGMYILEGEGDLNGNAKPFQYAFEISPTGTTLSTGQGIIYFIGVFISTILFCLALIGAIMIPWNNNRNEEGEIIGMNDLKYVKLGLWFVSYILLIMITWLAYNISFGYLQFNVASNIFNAMYWFLMSMFFPIIAVMFVLIVVRFVKDQNIKKALDRGLSIR